MLQFKINKIDAIGSTNLALRDAFKKDQLKHGHVLWALNQTQGKGQRGAVWSVEANKNLTFSVFLSSEKMTFSSPNMLNFCVSLALKKCLETFDIPTVSIKWPNDMLSGNKKIGGILIENVYRGAQLNGIIIGIGLNVNQEKFEDLPQASSMRLVSGRVFNLEEVLKQFLNSFDSFIAGNIDEASLFEHYQKALFSLNERREFRTDNDSFFAKVNGVDWNGQLELKFDEGEVKTFTQKSLQWIY